MSLGAGIYEYLSDTLTVGERVYPLTLPERVTLPAISWQLVADDPVLTHASAQDNPIYSARRYEQSRIQFNTWAETFDDAEALAEELRTAITGFRGTWGSVDIQTVLPVLSLDDYEPETGLFRRISDYTIAWIDEDGS